MPGGRPGSPHALQRWDELSNQNWPTLIVGNGLSINVSPKFRYDELLSNALMETSARRLFTDLDTTNFEVVLEALWHAQRVLRALQQPRHDVSQMYRHVQSQLVAAVRKVHVEWSDVSPSSFTQIAKQMDKHDMVFTLNYDLLTYWARMDNQCTTDIVDYLWNSGNTFEPTNTGRPGNKTGLIYLHGGVHLWQDIATGQTGKWTAQKADLLTGLRQNLQANRSRQPLIVSEGTSAQKMSVIRRSDYLSFAHRTLNDDERATVIFGLSLGPQDQHVVDAINVGPQRKLAISIHPGSTADNTATMAYYETKFPQMHLNFFDSTTHPLGSPTLRVP